MLSCRRPCRARRTTRLPELAEVFREFLAGGSPVGLYGVAELDHVALEVEFVFLEPRDVEFFARGAALELAVDVLVVVADDPKYVSIVSWTESVVRTNLVMMPVVERPSVRWVTRNMPLSLMGP